MTKEVIDLSNVKCPICEGKMKWVHVSFNNYEDIGKDTDFELICKCGAKLTGSTTNMVSFNLIEV